MKKNSINYQPTADAIQKKIETVQKNIILENKKAIPNHKTITNLINRQIILENELHTIHNQRIDVLIIQKAKQCVYTALNTIHTKTADTQIQQTMYSIWQHSDITDTLPLAQELIGIASLAIIETAQASVLTLNSFLELDFYTIVYKQFTTKNKQQSYHTPFTYTLTQVNQFIHAQKSTKGRKTVSQYQTVKQSDCITYDNAGNITRIDKYDSERIAVKQGFAMELVSLSAAIEQPENYHRLSVEYDLLQDADYYSHLHEMKRSLSEMEKTVFDLLQQNYTQAEIADKLQKHYNTVNTLVRRIRQKIASIKINNEYAYNYEVVRKYR